MKPLRAVPFLALMVAALACGSSNTPNTDPPKNDIADKSYTKLSACRGSATDSEVDNHLEIATSFEESAHEMIVCGGLVVSLAVGVVEIIINEAAGKKGRPDGLTFDGKGNYTSPQMDVSFYLGEDTSFGKAGDLVPFDLLDVSTYLTGAKAKVNSTRLEGTKLLYDIDVSFTGTGPAVELLGLGPAPQSPWHVDFAQLQTQLKKLVVAAKVHVKDTQAHADVTYDIDVPKTPLSAVIGGRQEMVLLSMAATRKDLGQSMAAREFTIGFEDVGDHALDGIIRVDVSGGKMPFQVLYSYPRRATPDVVIGCPGDKLVAPAGSQGSGGSSSGQGGGGQSAQGGSTAGASGQTGGSAGQAGASGGAGGESSGGSGGEAQGGSGGASAGAGGAAAAGAGG